MTCCAVRHVGSREYDSRLACPPKTCLTKKGRERESSVELAEDRGYPDGFNMQAEWPTVVCSPPKVLAAFCKAISLTQLSMVMPGFWAKPKAEVTTATVAMALVCRR
ncbi:unnamed protein product [Durusdinium trenchii]|uniref:Uncharacterized protein n=1 Tax=Durusdinium trenchii TaxID=1381693 RepID=A0ABP0PXG0_9DINO